MDRKIVKLHGTSGSGKSTVARELLVMGEVEPVATDGKVEAYRVWIHALKHPLYIIGRYESACGGCDTIPASHQIELLHKYAALGHVFYEGLLASEYYGKLGEESERYGANHIFAFLDTPIDLCIERVKARRLAKGNDKPLNEDNTRGRVKKIEKLAAKLSRMGRTVVVVPHQRAGEAVYELFTRS